VTAAAAAIPVITLNMPHLLGRNFVELITLRFVGRFVFFA
jgi:hypothetical protein